MMEHTQDQAVGVVRDYFRKVSVAAVEVTRGTIRAGDTLRFLGHTTDLVQRIESMQANHQDVLEASKGDFVGIKVTDRVREGDLVYIESGKTEDLP
jgi:translation initiation factor IF-2